MLFPPARRGRRGKDARAESERDPENRAEERGAEGSQPEERAAFGSGTTRDYGIMPGIAMSGLGMLMILGMSGSGMMRVIVADMVVGMHDGMHQLMRVLRQPAVRFQADMEHRSEPDQGQEERKDRLPIAHAFTVAATKSGNTNRNQALRDKQRYLSPAATTLHSRARYPSPKLRACRWDSLMSSNGRERHSGQGQPSVFPAYHARQGSALRASTTALRAWARRAFAWAC